MYRKEYENKRIRPEQAVERIQSGQHIVIGGGPIEPLVFVDALKQLRGNVRDVHVTCVLSLSPHEIMIDPSYAETFRFDSCFYSPVQRMSDRAGLCSYNAAHLRNSGPNLIGHYGAPDLYVCTVSPMDKNGYFTTGPGVIYDYEAIRAAKCVVFEVNAQTPRTFGDTVFHISEADYLYETDRPVPTIPIDEVTDADRRIGEYVADLIPDGSTIQLGIGSIPNAAAQALTVKKHLGVHTEMLNDSIVDLFQSGAIDGRHKTLYPNKIVTAFSLGSRKVYDFIDDNPGVLHLRVSYINDPLVIAQNENMISVNTTLMIDLYGQCASESVGRTQISGTGGQVETAIGAQMSRGGKSIMTLHSTATIKDPVTKQPKRVSKIVPFFEEGTIVTLPRTDVEYVVTEYGVARLKGAPLNTRVKELIRLAHPDFREELTRKAADLRLI